MRIALVHDYIKEFGGAERVLKVLSEIYPDAPIYTAFKVYGSSAEKEFRGSKIIESWLAPILKIGRLYSPLRFLIPVIWEKFDLSSFDLVIISCSWYITRGFKIGPNTKVIAYCHTPPRWLYGYETSVNFKKYLPVKIYAAIVSHFIRMYDFKTARLPYVYKKKIIAGVNVFIANSKNIERRIEKFYRRDSIVVYPPVDIKRIMNHKLRNKKKVEEKYFLVVSRLVGAKGIENAINAFRSKSLINYKLKIVGEAVGIRNFNLKINNVGNNIEFLGRVQDEELWNLYANAEGFIALARDEDFGMTVVEAQAAGCPVIAFHGGGFLETIIGGKTGVFVKNTDRETIYEAVKTLTKTKWNKDLIINNVKKFSKEIFVTRIKNIVGETIKNI